MALVLGLLKKGLWHTMLQAVSDLDVPGVCRNCHIVCRTVGHDWLGVFKAPCLTSGFERVALLVRHVQQVQGHTIWQSFRAVETIEHILLARLQLRHCHLSTHRCLGMPEAYPWFV